MKIKHWDLHLTWEDGSVHEVSSYVSMRLVREVEDFIDYWEEKHGEENNIDVSKCEAKAGDEDSFSNLDS